jgi:hypothetical protein
MIRSRPLVRQFKDNSFVECFATMADEGAFTEVGEVNSVAVDFD